MRAVCLKNERPGQEKEWGDPDLLLLCWMTRHREKDAARLREIMIILMGEKARTRFLA
jgi:hypothetical protein